MHEVIDTEPHLDEFHILYGELAALGISRGKPFAPDERMTRFLERGHGRAGRRPRPPTSRRTFQAFADRRQDPCRLARPRWECAALRFEDGDFNADGHLDVDAREKSFFQAIGASPAMFNAAPAPARSSGSACATSPAPTSTAGRPIGCVCHSRSPASCSGRSRSRSAELGHAALGSLFELARTAHGGSLELFFGPHAPDGHADRWLQTIPCRGWYLRICGPEATVFDGSWKPGDFEPV